MKINEFFNLITFSSFCFLIVPSFCYYNYYKTPIDLKAFFNITNPNHHHFQDLQKSSNRLKSLKISSPRRIGNTIKDNKIDNTNLTSLALSTARRKQNQIKYDENGEIIPIINQIDNLEETNYSPDVNDVLLKKQIDDDHRVGYWVTNIEYIIKIHNYTCDANYKIHANYRFQKGEFSSFMFKASIAGTVDENLGIAVDSETDDIRITEIKVVLNCIDPDQQSSDPYACIVVILHRPINARYNAVDARFTIKFVALGFLRRDESTLNNFFILNLDNNRREKAISDVNVMIKFYTNIPINTFLAKPSSFIQERTFDMKDGEKREYDSVKWHFQEIPGLATQSIIGMFSEAFKIEKCRPLNDIDYLGNNRFSFVQYLTWTIILGLLSYLIIFISVNEKEKYFLYKYIKKEDEEVFGRM